MDYTDLLIEADACSLITKEKPLRANDARIKGNRIAIRSDISFIQKKCVLAEELGHYYTSSGNIIDQSDTTNRKQEYRARYWAYNRLVNLHDIISAYNAGCRTFYEMSDYLDVTEEFFCEAMESYRAKYGICKTVGKYMICFEPLGIQVI